MVRKHRFSREGLSALFARARSQPQIIALMDRPVEAKPWYVYRDIFLTPTRIQHGVTFWRTHQSTLARAEQVYGVPAEVLVAILGVETSYGARTGDHRVLEALATLAFDYPRRAAYFREELVHYLLLTREEGIDPLFLKGSYAGAMGLAQFMPSSYRAYAVDFDGDQRRDLWSNPRDALGSVAAYLHRHRWQRGAPIAVRARVSGDSRSIPVDTKLKKPSRSLAELRHRGVRPEGTVSDQQKVLLIALEGADAQEYWLGCENFYAITRYNTSPLYAMAVYQLSQEIRARYQAR
jgi:membrane-bound lytic murein transglycosylase B